MPLVLSAIDVKLSQSGSEMLERKRYLDFFPQIIGQARTTYDVTDYFSEGTNHILRLAYAITKELFLSDTPNEYMSRLARDVGVDKQIQKGDGFGGKGLVSRRARRIRSWAEGFVEYPLAYLCISATVDYSMAYAILPSENCLPPMLRHVTTVIFQTTHLPPAMSGNLSN
jgi:hypothetical protein